MADSGHPPAELHERLLICRTIKLNAGAHGGHRRCCHAQMQKNAQNKPQIARLILCVHTTLQVYCNLFLTFCILRLFFALFLLRNAALPRTPLHEPHISCREGTDNEPVRSRIHAHSVDLDEEISKIGSLLAKTADFGRGTRT